MKKKLLLSFLLFPFFFDAAAQTITAKAGLNVNSMYVRSMYSKQHVNDLLGFHIGSTIDVPIYERISIEGGVLLIQKGFKEVYAEEEYRHRPLYLDFPVVGKYKYRVDNSFASYGIFGMYLGLGVGGTTQRIDTYQGINSYKRPIPWGSYNNSDINLLTTDAGIILGGGVEFSSFQFGVSYNIGVENISPYAAAGNKLANRVFSLSLGYKIYELALIKKHSLIQK